MEREFINHYFLLNIDKINKISNNELSFYFVAGVEFGSQFKIKDEENNLQILLQLRLQAGRGARQVA